MISLEERINAAMPVLLQIPVVALSQLNRKLEERSNKRPVMSDLKESGDIEQDADLIMFLYRDAVYNDQVRDDTMEIDLQKNRHGGIGRVYAGWQPEYLTVTSEQGSRS